MVLLSIDELTFLLGMTSPEQEDDAAALGIQGGDNPIGELLPTKLGVRVRHTGLNSQNRIQQQDALGRPAHQIAMRRDLKAWDIARQLFVDIHQ